MKALLEQLDTSGGHIAICFVLILTGAALWACHVPKAEDLIVGATGVLFGSMRGATKTQEPKQ